MCLSPRARIPRVVHRQTALSRARGVTRRANRRSRAMSVSNTAVCAFAVQFFGYIALSTALELWFYVDWRDNRDSSATHSRKIQRHKRACGTVRVRRSDPWGLPMYQLLFAKRPALDGRGGCFEHHRVFASVNLLTSATFAGIVGEAVHRGAPYTSLYGNAAFGWDYGILACVWGFVKAVVWQSVAEYAWHRVMHGRYAYARWHKAHHAYTSPCVWCDLCIHPLEALGYYVILYSPAFVIPMPMASFLAYMGVMGVAGVLDHSGVDLAVRARGIGVAAYETTFHDLHHARFNVNYAFPFDFMDRAFGTLGARAAVAATADASRIRRRPRAS